MSASEESERPGPGERYNPGPAVAAAPGGERDPAARRRAGSSRCCSSGARPRRASWAACGCSPGGAVDAGEGDGEDAHRAAAIRELREEAAIDVEDPGALVKFSRWITPAQVQIRFDTHFFLASLPAGQEPRVDGEECVDLGWFTPQAALDAHRAGEIALVFPTIKHLEQLREFHLRRGAARACARTRCAAGRAAGDRSRARSRASCCRAIPATDRSQLPAGARRERRAIQLSCWASMT